MNKHDAKLKRCDIASCKGMCCYDGVYLMDGEPEYISKVVEKHKDFFSFLPNNYIVDGNWKGLVQGKKTTVRSSDNFTLDFPDHFEKTMCVFADSIGKCSLQSLACKLGIHKWTFKPVACWMFPLRFVNGEITPPPRHHKDDPNYVDESYPGYTTYARCGRHFDHGMNYKEALSEEIAFVENLPCLPFWPFLDKNIQEIIDENRKILDTYDL